MAKPAVDCSSTGCVNTMLTWRIQGRFLVIFSERIHGFLLRGRAGVAVRGTRVVCESLRIIQSYGKKCLKFYIGDDPAPIEFPHRVVRAIWDDDGIVWFNLDAANMKLRAKREAGK